jgi:cytochrome c-type biogenesis protein CcmH/NrfG
MKPNDVILRAKNEVQEERNKEAVEALKKLYRQLADAQDVVKSIERKIKLEESKIED